MFLSHINLSFSVSNQFFLKKNQELFLCLKSIFKTKNREVKEVQGEWAFPKGNIVK